MRYLIKHMKRRLLKAINAIGYEVEKPSGHYRIHRKFSLGHDLCSDVQVILSREPKCVFDIGANEGQTTLSFLYAFPRARIYSFEPSPQSYPALAALAKARPRVHAVQAAVGSQSGKLPFHCNEFHQTDSLLAKATGAEDYLVSRTLIDTHSTVPVSVLTLDEFCREYDIGYIDLLKIDTQGYEIEVLKGAREMLDRQAIPLIYLEVCFAPVYQGQSLFPDVYQYLYDRDYRLVHLYGAGFATHYYQVGADGLFVHRGIGTRIRPSD
jgi:FkbM family methyltransferase